jgi:hypothetical protein
MREVVEAIAFYGYMGGLVTGLTLLGIGVRVP